MTESRLETLTREVCMQRLREATVGRIAVVVDDDPIILPVNYRLVEPHSGPLIVLRTRPGNVIEQAPTTTAFEIDSIDPVGHQGWSVVVRGELLHATPTSAAFRERYDPASWLTDDRDAWLIIDPFVITGRELHGAEANWSLQPAEYT